MNKVEILMQIKKELARNPHQAKGAWYHEQGQFGLPDFEVLKRLPNPRLNLLVKEWEKSIREEEKQGEQYKQYKQAVADLFKEANEEIKQSSEKPHETLISPKQEEFDESPYRPEEDWCREVGKAAGLKKDNINKPIVLVPKVEPTPETWYNEVQAAAQQLLNPFSASPELREMAREFLAKLVPTKFVWEASNWSASEGLVTGVLMPYKEFNVNGWRVDESEVDNLLKQLNSGRIRFIADHGKSIRDILGTCRKAELDENTIRVECDTDDAKVNKILKRHGKTLGLSIGMKADAFCFDCGKKGLPEQRCANCGSTKKILKNCEVTEISLVTSPAWRSAKVEKFEELD